jgi:HSP20 family protein
MPWDLRALHERLERLANPHSDSWTPAIDVYETGPAYVVTAEVPGLTRDEIDLAIDQTRLTIQGRRADRHAASGNILHFHQVERGHGAFVRTFEFAEHIDVERVSADLADGVLTVTLPKVPSAPTRRIEVR